MKRQEKELNSFYEDDNDDRENEDLKTNLEQGITFYLPTYLRQFLSFLSKCGPPSSNEESAIMNKTLDGDDAKVLDEDEDRYVFCPK